MPRSLLPAATLAALALMAFAPAGRADDAPTAAPAYLVNLSLRMTVGQKFGYVADGSQNLHAVTTLTGLNGNGTPRNQEQNQTILIHLEAEGEVSAVLARGGVEKETLTVKVFSAKSDDKTVTGLPGAGAKIVVERKDTDEMTFTVDDKPASDDIAALLGTVLRLESAKYSDQEIFGPAGAVAAGATWPANETALLGIAQGYFGGATSAKGTLKLDSVEGAGSDAVFNVSGHASFAGVKSPMPPTPPLVADPATAETELTCSIPASTTKGVFKESRTTTVEATSSANIPSAPPPGSSVPINIQVKVMATEQKKMVSALTFR